MPAWWRHHQQWRFWRCQLGGRDFEWSCIGRMLETRDLDFSSNGVDLAASVRCLGGHHQQCGRRGCWRCQQTFAVSAEVISDEFGVHLRALRWHCGCVQRRLGE